MTVSSSIASPRRLRDGFTPLPTYINPVNVGRFSGRGLSIPAARKNFRFRSTCNATCNSVAFHQFS